ncbi:MAG: hypothetical protein CL943_03150 [Candidatus Diapherotrites archaeon]|uniref:Transcription factor Pcc1 n=1 Tax=Candidatus Iainarchaeum sp. TaxID=3101447 RepID=A0A2D6M1H3_9ARCH|nr:hypothetical protein [Candidatus Diapherotrites archaeon]|tara:strand:+ start:7786 stop:8034 length:249 start_codon:yes stop_codon:yes gene_type:complete
MKAEYACSVKLHFDTTEQAENVMNAILPDLNSVRNHRSETEIKVNKAILILNIKAQDAVALRASMNGCLKLIGLVQKILEVR